MLTMLSLKVIFYSVAFYVTVNAFMAIQPPVKTPEKYADQEGCYIPNLDIVLQYSTPYAPTDGSCVSYTCQTDNNTEISGCSALGLGPGCEIAPGNKSLPYPRCCNGIRCKNPDGTYKEMFPY